MACIRDDRNRIQVSTSLNIIQMLLVFYLYDMEHSAILLFSRKQAGWNT